MGNVKIIGASAGSGKTYRLAYEYVKSVVGDPTLYRRTLAVTFTNKATEEMRSRILERIHELAAGEPSPYMAALVKDLASAGFTEAKIRARAAEVQSLILHDYGRFAVLTIDRFFQRLIRAFIRELGVEAGFNLELETDSLLSLAADALIDESADDEKLRRLLHAAARDLVDEGKSWNVREPLLALGRELFGEEYQRTREALVESAGAGEAVDASSIIEAVVRKAAVAQNALKTLARRALAAIGEAGLTADDFKGRSRSFVAYLTKATGEFLPLSNPARAAMESSDPATWCVKNSPNRGVVEDMIPILQPMLAEMDEIYTTNHRLVSSARLLRENHRNFLLLTDLQKNIEQICSEQNIMPISETNRMIARLVGGGDTPFIFEKAGTRYSRYMIDEFQDTSRSQWENFVPLLRDAIATEEGTPVMLIGDVKQAIYRWRGGDWQILSRRVAEEMGPRRVERESLDRNYRSLPRLVEWCNRAIGLIAKAGSEKLDAMIAEALAEGALDAGEAASLTGMLAEAYAGHEQKPLSDSGEGYVTLTLYGPNDAGDYIPPVVARVEDLQRRGYRAGDIAVLVRSNTQGARVAQMLLQHKHDNPSSPYVYDVVTAEALTVGASAASRFIIACLSLGVEGGSRDAEGGSGSAYSGGGSIQRAIYNRWLGRAVDEPLTAGDAGFFARLGVLSPEQAFEEVVLRYELTDRAEEVAYLGAIHQQIVTFSSKRVADLPLFLKWWNEKGASASITMQAGDKAGGAGAITVSTIHKSKGIEYKAVIVPYLSWAMGPETRGRGLVVWADTVEEGLGEVGAMPINYKEIMSQSFFSTRYYREQVLAHIDAANLFYVAVTRAGRELHLMSATNPRLGAGTVGEVLKGVLGITGDFTEWGAPTTPPATAPTDRAPETSSATGPLRSYPTSRPDAKIRLRLPTSRYFEHDDLPEALSPRDFGILMHRAFENAVGRDDVMVAVGRMLAEGHVSQAEHDRLAEMVERAFQNPLVAEWFGGGWSEVRGENAIVIPGQSTPKRPDRVMTQGTRAVVVDYKFGRGRPAAHATQLRGYMTLLDGMGYTAVEGYLWYVAQGEIEQVAI